MTNAQVVLLVVVVAAVAAAVLILLNVRRSRRLRARFGPEYQRAIHESGATSRGEQRLAQLEKRVERFHIRSLSELERSRFAEAWQLIQRKFVDDPKGALTEADQLLGEIMSARGYPVTDFEQQAADLSVNHPYVVEQYRCGHEIAVRHGEGRASTEDLRQAMIHYRRLFEDLTGDREAASLHVAGTTAGK
jgi:hypothetical protein